MRQYFLDAGKVVSRERDRPARIPNTPFGRRRLLSGDSTAALVAGAVGYESATQFNREYRRVYGLPPAQDAARLRGRLVSTLGA